VAVPELDPTALNVVVPQPLLVAGSPEAGIANDGKTNDIWLLEIRGTFSINVKEIDDVVDMTGFSILKTLCCNTDDIGAVIAVDDVVGIVVAVMSVASAKVTVTVRALSEGLDVVVCAFELVVTPVCTRSSQRVPAFNTSVEASAVRRRVAAAVPEFELLETNVVVPHPFLDKLRPTTENG